jgi:hypothetical protein
MPPKPKLFSERVVKTICDGLVLMLPQRVAAHRAGISESIYYVWVRTGERTRIAVENGEEVDDYDRACLSFLERVENAKAEGEAALVASIHAAVPQTWQAAAWLLERRRPDQYSRKMLKPDEGAPTNIQVTFNRPEIDLDEQGDDLVVGTDAGNGNGSNGSNGEGGD